jgi:ribosomal protein S8
MNFFSYILGKILNFLNTLFILRFQLLNNKNFIKYFLYLKKINSLSKRNINNKYKNQKLNISQIKKIKKTNEVFIYGSGYSINEISNEEWKKLRNYDSIGFNNTIFLKKISFTYHINRVIQNPQKNVKKQIKMINKNRYLKKTTFLMPEGFIEEYTNNIFSKNLWDKSKKFFLFKTNRLFEFTNWQYKCWIDS